MIMGIGGKGIEREGDGFGSIYFIEKRDKLHFHEVGRGPNSVEVGKGVGQLELFAIDDIEIEAKNLWNGKMADDKLWDGTGGSVGEIGMTELYAMNV